jgi:hypothetical protein
MFRIRRFGVIKTANVVAVLYIIVVVVIVIPIGVLVALAGSRTNFGGTGAFAGNAAGVSVLVFGLLAAILYGIFGWIFTAIACLIYNFAARIVGGIEIQLEAVEPPPPPVVWGAAASVPAPPVNPPAEPPTGAPPTS